MKQGLSSVKKASLPICFFITTALLFGISIHSFAQGVEPLNSNYLIEHGVSPRILDAAASSLLQEGSFSQQVMLSSDRSGTKKTYEMQIIYDPKYTDGMDIRIVVDADKISKKETKYLKDLVKRNHHFSRMSRHYLYDESTLKLVKNEDSEVVFEYYYQKKDIEPHLKVIKRLKGEIYFKNSELEYVVLSNYKSLKGGVKNYERKVFFEHIPELGGHIIKSIEETAIVEKGGNTFNYVSTSYTSDYTSINGDSVPHEYLDKAVRTINNEISDTLSVKLGWVLPLLGKPATKLGYKLPRPVGLNIFSHFQTQNMEFTDLSIAMNDEEEVSFAELLALDQSSVTQSSFMTMAKADVWIFPFLNIMGIFGAGENSIEGNLLLDEDFKQSLIDYGWILGIDKEEVPDEILIKTGVSSQLYGGGLTVAGGVGDFNISLNYQLMFAKMVEANTVNTANVFTPMIGYMTPFGMNIMLGAQGQFYDTRIKGFIDLEDGQRLHYNVNFKPMRWNGMVGIYKGFAKHWEIALQGGFGDRESITAVFGYRF